MMPSTEARRIADILFTGVRGRGILRSSYTKICIAPVSSITDHRRLMYVAILCQLSKHEVCDVLPRYSGSFVRISAEKDLVLARGTLVSDPRWAHDHPLSAAASEYLLLTLFVFVLISQHQGQEDPIVEETDVPLAVPSPNTGDANQPAYAMLLHRADEVCSTGREKGRGLRAARAQRREHSVLSRYGSLHRLWVQHVAAQHARTVLSRCNGRGVAS